MKILYLSLLLMCSTAYSVELSDFFKKELEGQHAKIIDLQKKAAGIDNADFKAAVQDELASLLPMVDTTAKSSLLGRGKYRNYAGRFLSFKKRFASIKFDSAEQAKSAIHVYQQVINKMQDIKIIEKAKMYDFTLKRLSPEEDVEEYNVLPFIREVCHANRMAIPRVYVGIGRENPASVFGFENIEPIIFFNPCLLARINATDDEVRAIIAHELGHLYYQDVHCTRLQIQEPDPRGAARNHLMEYRADMFAAQYGLSQAFASIFSKLSEFTKFPLEDQNATYHYPATLTRIQAMQQLQPIAGVQYMPRFTATGPVFDSVRNPKNPHKIIDSSAQPLKHVTLRTPTSASMNMARRALGTLRLMPK